MKRASLVKENASMCNPRNRLATLAALVLGGALAREASAQTLTLSVDTLAFVGRVGGPNPPPQTIAITNTGGGALTWRVVPSTVAPWLTVSPPSGGAPQNPSFSVSLAGLSPGVYTDTVQIASNDPDTPTIVVVTLTVAPANAPANAAGGPAPGPLPPIPTGGRYLAEYQVEFIFTGYVGELDGYPNCRVDTAGTDRMVGNLVGYEPPTPDEDVEYTGTLHRVTRIDFCETKKAPSVDQRAWCVVSLTGATNMRANLTLYGEADRGAWLKAVVDTGLTTKAVQGNCDPQETSDALGGYPTASDGGAGSPNGQPIEDQLSPTKFFVGGLARLKVGTYLPRPKLASWSLRVIRKIR
jgi:hypothetical protein